MQHTHERALLREHPTDSYAFSLIIIFDVHFTGLSQHDCRPSNAEPTFLTLEYFYYAILPRPRWAEGRRMTRLAAHDFIVTWAAER